jgi:hypothetical protein
VLPVRMCVRAAAGEHCIDRKQVTFLRRL